MRCQPFSHEAQRASWNRAGENLAGRDDDRCLITAVAGVEVRGRMVSEVHLDHDSIELADPRHVRIIASKPDAGVAADNSAATAAGERRSRPPSRSPILSETGLSAAEVLLMISSL